MLLARTNVCKAASGFGNRTERFEPARRGRDAIPVTADWPRPPPRPNMPPLLSYPLGFRSTSAWFLSRFGIGFLVSARVVGRFFVPASTQPRRRRGAAVKKGRERHRVAAQSVLDGGEHGARARRGGRSAALRQSNRLVPTSSNTRGTRNLHGLPSRFVADARFQIQRQGAKMVERSPEHRSVCRRIVDVVVPRSPRPPSRVCCSPGSLFAGFAVHRRPGAGTDEVRFHHCLASEWEAAAVRVRCSARKCRATGYRPGV